MTLHEIEETLQSLRSRHPGLDEGMLVTLLRAGGWEEKQIEEAKVVFRGGMTSAQHVSEDVTVKVVASLPAIQDGPVFPATTDVNHLLDAPHEIEVQNPTSEPQSLVMENLATSSDNKREELPHNLPLRPFETSEHIWPFSRYRDVFYGDFAEEAKPVPEAQAVTNIYVAPAPITVSLEQKQEVPIVQEIVKEKMVEKVIEKDIQMPEVHIERVKLSGGDEKLIVMTCVMLLVILLLLGYMYSNGRL